eukprot:7380784-Prymnesium_polylepis.6
MSSQRDESQAGSSLGHTACIRPSHSRYGLVGASPGQRCSGRRPLLSGRARSRCRKCRPRCPA